MNKLDELIKYLEEYPELAQKLENASQEDGIQMILDTNLFSSKEEFFLALHNQKLSDQELEAASGGGDIDLSKPVKLSRTDRVKLWGPQAK